MPRIARTLVNERNSKVVEAFRAIPEPSVKEVNEALFVTYGRRMGMKTLYELREKAREEKKATADAAAAEVAAGLTVTA